MTIVKITDAQKTYGSTLTTRALNRARIIGTFVGLEGTTAGSNIKIFPKQFGGVFEDSDNTQTGQCFMFLDNATRQLLAHFSGNNVWRTRNGFNWNLASLDITNGLGGSINWGLAQDNITRALVRLNSGRIVFVNDTCFCWSDDGGINWSSELWTDNHPAEFARFWAIATDGETIRGVSTTGNRVLESTDGVNWAIGTSPRASGRWIQINYFKELEAWYACGRSSNDNRMRVINYQKGGTGWANVTTTGLQFGRANAIAYSPTLNRLCTVAATDCYIRSADGGNWSEENIAAGGTNKVDVIWSKKFGSFITTDTNDYWFSETGLGGTWQAELNAFSNSVNVLKEF